MIKKIRSKLSVKIFLFTALLLAGCCGVTCACILRFAPYVYRHEVSETEDLVAELAMAMKHMPEEELVYLARDFEEIIEQQTDGEYVFRVFNGAGEELNTADTNTVTGKQLADFADADKSKEYTVSMGDGAGTCTVFASKNTEKESQVAEALCRDIESMLE